MTEAPPPRNVLIQLFILGQLAGQLMGREFAQDGIDRNDYAVLTVIGFYGPITPTDLATKLGLPPTTLSISIRRLGAHVARRPHPTGGRTAATSGRRSPRTASWSGSTRPPIRSSRR